MKALKTWQLAEKSLAQNTPVMLLHVLESDGSSPGRQGFFMIVNQAGDMEGSIGGGIMEHKFVEMAKRSLEEPDDFHDIKKQYHDKSAAQNQSGMICSGEQTIFLYKLKTTELPAIRKMIASLEANLNGTLQLSGQGLSFDDQVPAKPFEYFYESPLHWHYREMTGYKEHLFIIGGGHCSLALSRLMRSMDFYIRVYDERKDLKTMMENDAAHERHFIDDYTQLFSFIPSGPNHYVVIMTFGYRTDDIALRALLYKDFRYLGLLGSRNKIDKLMDDYRVSGIPAEKLDRIRTPVGLPIRSQTPEEIAVSIAAEIIRVKNDA